MLSILMSPVVYAGEMQNIVDQGDYQFITSQNIDLSSAEVKISCTTYNKLRIFGAPVGSAEHVSESVQISKVSHMADETLANGLEIRKMQITLNKDLELRYEMPFNHQLHACNLIWKVKAIGSKDSVIYEANVSNGIHHNESNSNVTSDFVRVLDTQIIYLNKYANNLRKNFITNDGFIYMIK